MLAPERVEPADQRQQRAVEAAVAQLVLLRVAVLLRPLAATGSYQPWWNEDCTGSLTLDDTYHFNDPTTAGPEPIIHTTGTRPLKTGDTPLTIETDLNRARTRYLFITPSTGGFQQEAARGDAAKLVEASAAPMATMDFTLEGPIGDGKREVAVQGGKLWVDWVFTRGRSPR